LTKSNYPWAEDAWMIWCHFPNPVDFVKSLAGVRNLVPDSGPGKQIGEDEENKPTTYCVHRYKRQPPAPSLLGSTEVEEIISNASDAVAKQIEDLLNACDGGELKKVRHILDARCNVNSKDDTGLTAISVAAGLGHKEMVQELISRKADVNAMDGEGDSVLTVAVGEGRVDVVKLLLEHGADKELQVAGVWIDCPDKKVSLTEVAQKKGFPEIVEALKAGGKPAAAASAPAAQKAAPAAPAASGPSHWAGTLADELGGLDVGGKM